MQTIESKITRLIELTGTPPSRIPNARAAYLRLAATEGENAIDAKLAEFGGMQTRVRAWAGARAGSR